MPLPSRRTLLPLLGVAAAAWCSSSAPCGRREARPAPRVGIGGPFALVDSDGKTVTEADFAGQPVLVFFGYTHCPDVCPTTLDAISQTLKALGPDKKVQALFITRRSRARHAGRDEGLPVELRSADHRADRQRRPRSTRCAHEYRVYAKKVPTTDGDYSVDHTGVVYLMDTTATFVESFNPDLDDP